MQFDAVKCVRAIACVIVTVGISLPVPKVCFAQVPPASSISKSEQRKEDRQLAKDVRLALNTNKVNTNDIRILARRGVVSLTGYVPDPSQITKAAMVAQSVPGVTAVKSYLILYVNGG
ncbi:BON domain-containing protein [Paraburkholderia pallida]|uniref:BON domain-containing protein n=1 Tax=Paraburkholderia pallida TaxID=2547399 RepID=A0A4P7D8I1_9BURK|nr:BON domain-containing protein [Paraburkholderia pallida]QBR03727.1 BON domain-containing protein [Paraburkholderia pallida]